MYNQGPFATWVPKPLMLLLILLIMPPLAVVSGVFTTNITDISGALGVYADYIAAANNAGTIGMGLALSIIMRVKVRFRSKEILVGTSIIVALLLLLNGTTDNPHVLIVGSLLIGFFKMFGLMEMILPVLFILSPQGERGRFYSLFYPIIIVVSQVAGYFFAGLIANSGYQAPYLLMAAIMLGVAALGLIFQHNQRFARKMPLYQLDWLSLLLLATSAMAFNYALSFMRQQGWFQAGYVPLGLVAGVAFLALTVIRQRFLKRKLIQFELIKREHVWHSLVLLLFVGIYLASSGIYVQYSMGVLGYSNLINAQLNLWMIPGILLSGVVAFFGFKKSLNLKYVILLGFFAFFLHSACLYFLIQPQLNIEYLYFPMFLKGLGMGLLFIVVWYYAAVNMTPEQSLGITAILLMVRTFFATALASALLGWAGYAGQWQSLNDLAGTLDAGVMASSSLYQSLQLNALMASGKVVLGCLCLLFFPIALFVLTHHYGQFNYRRVVFFRKMIRGNSLRGYRFAKA
ncbi:MFS transporter [Hymenobacter sp. ISL-91]|uniref:MFS transporter n=1 Tax=Hymenobacter sp. ISL-91 TaxID=2819151 RepID=UPI001BE628D0|nr:MFS transporter [Hymenobacter sp. ISL-91]MBT2556615.1 MFS transporter [Hymenobacter sp. ISL-91]